MGGSWDAEDWEWGVWQIILVVFWSIVAVGWCLTWRVDDWACTLGPSVFPTGHSLIVCTTNCRNCSCSASLFCLLQFEQFTVKGHGTSKHSQNRDNQVLGFQRSQSKLCRGTILNRRYIVRKSTDARRVAAWGWKNVTHTFEWVCNQGPYSRIFCKIHFRQL